MHKHQCHNELKQKKKQRKNIGKNGSTCLSNRFEKNFTSISRQLTTEIYFGN